MKITADTNVLLRAVLDDEIAEQQVAIETRESAEMVAISVRSICEFVWVLDRSYKTARANISAAIRRLLDLHNVVVNRPAVEMGLRMLDAGGDFADGIIAYEGNRLGGETFVSFDRRAVLLLAAQGRQERTTSPAAPRSGFVHGFRAAVSGSRGQRALTQSEPRRTSECRSSII